jgi:hypothetical protein
LRQRRPCIFCIAIVKCALKDFAIQLLMLDVAISLAQKNVVLLATKAYDYHVYCGDICSCCLTERPILYLCAQTAAASQLLHAVA